ncbi:MAG: tRNA (N(6)-L-threonylcarbamoyladenosine(37)-C(2))-methylthiotransferase MtaB, partial [Allorhizobium sp.]
PGTPAARMPQLDRALVKARAAGLRAVAERLQAMHLASRVGTRQKLLVERNEMAHTEDFTLVATPGMTPGSLIEVSIGGHTSRHLTIASAAANAAA